MVCYGPMLLIDTSLQLMPSLHCPTDASRPPYTHTRLTPFFRDYPGEPGWWRGSVVERRSLAGELSLSCARPAADG